MLAGVVVQFRKEYYSGLLNNAARDVIDSSRKGMFEVDNVGSAVAQARLAGPFVMAWDDLLGIRNDNQERYTRIHNWKDEYG